MKEKLILLLAILVLGIVGRFEDVPTDAELACEDACLADDDAGWDDAACREMCEGVPDE